MSAGHLQVIGVASLDVDEAASIVHANDGLQSLDHGPESVAIHQLQLWRLLLTYEQAFLSPKLLAQTRTYCISGSRLILSNSMMQYNINVCRIRIICAQVKQKDNLASIRLIRR